MARQGNPPGRHHPPGASPRTSHDATDATGVASGEAPASDADEPGLADHDARDSSPGSDGNAAAHEQQAPDSEASESDRALPVQPHGQVYFVLHTYVATGYEIEIAPLVREPDGRALGSDIRVRKNGMDPSTSDRHVEELAFAIESQHARAGGAVELHVQNLVTRGVRRIFSIGAIPARPLTETRASSARQTRPARRPGPLREWTPLRNAWRSYGDDAVIVDACLNEPVPVRALLDAVEADRAVARALIERRVDVIEEYGTRRYTAGKDDGYRAGSSEGYRAGKDEGYRAGKDEGYRAGKNDGYRAGTNDGYRSGSSDGMREAILLLLRARGIDLDEHAYARIAACGDMTILQRWLTRAVHVVSATALFDDA